jgi:hypothetical protein
MSIKEFIKKELFIKRLKQSEVLVVYDPDKLYRELCLELDNGDTKVIDTTESSLESRLLALETLRKLGEKRSKVKYMLVYVPAKPPEQDEDKQKDPFALYAACGACFPDGDSDKYQNICLKAKPEFAVEIRQVFSENTTPSFAVIDTIGSGTSWPNLQALLDKTSAREILFALMAPEEEEKEALESQDTWVSEAKELFNVCLGFNPITKINKWSAISDQLWRFMLFSEFVYDLPEALPVSLQNVPLAKEDAKHLIGDVCNNIRNDKRTKDLYIEKAEAIEKEMDLVNQCKAIKDLGLKDTFPFEERSFLAQAINHLKRDNLDEARRIINEHKDSVWTLRGESQAQWSLLQFALSISQSCEDQERALKNYTKSLDLLIDFYISSFKETDRLHREFEQNISEYFDFDEKIEDIVEFTRKKYYKLASKLQDLFIHHLEKTPWPPAEKLYNATVFDQFIQPALQQSGHKVAYFLIDSLRYELGAVLEKQLMDEGQVNLYPAFAMVPTITTVGMASLLPEASQHLKLTKDQDKVVVSYKDRKLSNVNQRMAVFNEFYGDRFANMTIEEFIKPRKKVDHNVDLLVITSTEIDSYLENTPDNAIQLIYQTLKKIRVAINKLKSMGYKDVVIATDHGFYLKTLSEAGDACKKPPGNWVNIHNRSLLGDGQGDDANIILSTKKLELKTDFNQLAAPKSLVSYRANEKYFHGGVSLQECLVPVLKVQLVEQIEEKPAIIVTITYKSGAKKITTRLPVLDIKLESTDLFSQGNEYEILIEAKDKEGNIIGEPKTGGPINPATGTLMIKPNEHKQFTLRMDPDFEGPFTVYAMNPKTMTTHSSIDLETDYVV